MNNRNKKSKKGNTNPFSKFSPEFGWVYENGFLVSKTDYSYKIYLKRGFLYNHPPVTLNKNYVSNN
jgi:hypothetical protein